MRTTKIILIAAGLAALGLGAVTLTPTAAAAQNQHMEVIHHPNYDRTVFMPFVPAIKIKSGRLLWLAGTTALPVYHDHNSYFAPYNHKPTSTNVAVLELGEPEQLIEIQVVAVVD